MMSEPEEEAAQEAVAEEEAAVEGEEEVIEGEVVEEEAAVEEPV